METAARHAVSLSPCAASLEDQETPNTTAREKMGLQRWPLRSQKSPVEFGVWVEYGFGFFGGGGFLFSFLITERLIEHCMCCAKLLIQSSSGIRQVSLHFPLMDPNSQTILNYKYPRDKESHFKKNQKNPPKNPQKTQVRYSLELAACNSAAIKKKNCFSQLF